MSELKERLIKTGPRHDEALRRPASAALTRLHKLSRIFKPAQKTFRPLIKYLSLQSFGPRHYSHAEAYPGEGTGRQARAEAGAKIVTVV